MAMAFELRRSVVGRGLGLGDDRGDLRQPTPLGVADLPDVLAGDEPGQEVGHVADEAGVADPQLLHERVFGEAAEEAAEGVRFGDGSAP